MLKIGRDFTKVDDWYEDGEVCKMAADLENWLKLCDALPSEIRDTPLLYIARCLLEEGYEDFYDVPQMRFYDMCRALRGLVYDDSRKRTFTFDYVVMYMESHLLYHVMRECEGESKELVYYCYCDMHMSIYGTPFGRELG